MWSDAMAPERQREAERNSPERSECTSGLGARRTTSGRVTPTQRPHARGARPHLGPTRSGRPEGQGESDVIPMAGDVYFDPVTPPLRDDVVSASTRS